MIRVIRITHQHLQSWLLLHLQRRKKEKAKTASKANIQPCIECYKVRMRIIHIIIHVLRVNIDSWKDKINNIMRIVKYE